LIPRLPLHFYSGLNSPTWPKKVLSTCHPKAIAPDGIKK
jgi:hypothetical protein